MRSSVKFSVGEDGPEVMAKDGGRGLGRARVIELDRGPTDVLREEDPEEGNVGARGGGCCRIRRRPDAPSPCSCSVTTGDLIAERGQNRKIYLSRSDIRDTKEVSIPKSVSGANHDNEKERTNLDIVSYSAAVKPASENRIRAFSALFGTFASRFPVLRFLGMERPGAGGVWLRPLSLSAVFVSSPTKERTTGSAISNTDCGVKDEY